VDDDFLKDPELLRDFIIESEEALQHMDEDMVALESAPSDADLLNSIFRAIHTIKGTSSFLGLDPIVELSHRTEDVLNTLRRGETRLTQRMMDALLGARDQLGRILSDLREQKTCSYAMDDLLQELQFVQKPLEGPPTLGEILVTNKIIPPEALESALAEQARQAKPEKLGEILVKQGSASPAQVGEALARQRSATESTSDARTMRVDVQKLDELINLIGELVLERNRLARLGRDLASGGCDRGALDEDLSQSTARLSLITEELQIAGLKTRMVPMESVFRKFPRLVRDVARSIGKEVELVVQGQNTEIDKTMVELIADPLVHLVRNSLDHGIELPEVREQAGKPRPGTIRLEASQEGDQIVIRVSDDGAGIDPNRVLAKALEKGLVSPERGRTLSQREILDFVFLPGFSTAPKLNNLSGRGVGLDVVRTNLQKLNGSVELESSVGKGTRTCLRVPLTLAILPVLLIEVCKEIYALPLRSVLETVRIQDREIHCVQGVEILRLRDETFPLLRLEEILGLPPSLRKSEQKVVIVAVGGQRAAVLVDRFIGQESTVIKPLGNYLQGSAQLAGATISGDGKVRLVLDPVGLLAAAQVLRQGASA
jgi:two-component system chemotaxis sensor kinase CheA